jgi:glycosyltransferase involved in cell wall biosynthesis
MKNSRAVSLLAFLEAKRWNRKKLECITDLFISPSAFLKEKMVSAGFHETKIEVLNNFIYKEFPKVSPKEDYYCYVGRISEEKGINTLIEVAQQLPYLLKVIGNGALLDDYKKQYGHHKNIEFTGQMDTLDVFQVISKARFMVMPSICYDNLPYSVIESLCLGVPVLGSRIGGIPELIDEGENGFLFTPGDINELKEKIRFCFSYFTDNYNFEKIAFDAQNKFDSGTFYNKLKTVYDH